MIWYGAVTMVAYRLGANWERATETLAGYQRSIVIGVGGVVVVAFAVWLVRRRQ